MKIPTPIITTGVTAKTEDTHAAEATSKISRSLSGSRNLGLADMHGRGLGLKVM